MANGVHQNKTNAAVLPVNKIGFVGEITAKVQRSLKGFSSPGAMNFKGTA